MQRLPHYLGQLSYTRAEERWIASGRLSPSKSSQSSSSPSVRTPIAERSANRTKAWKLAHQRKLEDGTWGYDPANKKIVEIGKKIVRISSLKVVTFNVYI